MADHDEKQALDITPEKLDYGEITAALIKEVQEGVISPADQNLIYTELISSNLARHNSNEELERVEKALQAPADYLDPLRQFLDTHGSAEEIINHLRGEINEIDGIVNAHLSELQTVKSHGLTGIREELDGLQHRIDRANDRLESTSKSVNRLEGSITGIEEEIDEIEEQLSQRPVLEERIGLLTDRVDELRSTTNRASNFRQRLLLAMDNSPDIDGN